MTVIAYSSKHRILAADSRASNNGMHLTNCQKIFVLKNGALFGASGDADIRDVVTLLDKATPRKCPTRAQIAELKCEFFSLLVFPKGQIFQIAGEFAERSGNHGEWVGEVIPIRDSLVATGSGAEFAYGAMEAGKTPVEAVRIACRRDLQCAPPVQWEKL